MYRAVPLALVVGCAGYVHVDPAKVTAVEVTTADRSNTYCAGGPAPQLVAIATLADGKRYETWRWENGRRATEGRLPFDAFRWSSDAGSVGDDGAFFAPAALSSLDRAARVTASVAGKSAVAGEVALVPRYDCGVAIELPGASGARGRNGADGSSGSDGSSASSDDFAAGDGGRGGDGDDGQPGGHGEPGPALDVAIGLVQAPQRQLAIVRVAYAGGTGARYAVISLDGSLRVDARGGRGGDGGAGGSGGSGGRGGTNSGTGGNGSDGSSGSDGAAGVGGNGGRGGMVVVHYDARHPELAKLIEADTGGGRGGAGRRVGIDGAPGAPPLFAPSPAAELFAGELARGIPVVVE